MASDPESTTDLRDFLKFTAKRILRTIPVLFGVTLIVFLIFRVMPGDVESALCGRYCSDETQQFNRKKWGLDKSPQEQYLVFLERLIFHQDLGISYSQEGTPVSHQIAQRLPATLELSFVALLLGIVIGVPLGILSAYFYHTKIDYLATTSSIIGMSMPMFWLGIILQDVFAKELRWFTATGRIAPELESELVRYTNFYLIDSFLMGILEGRWEFFFSVISQLVLPALTLGLVVQAILARTIRSLTIAEFRKDYVRTARAKGLKEQLVVINHATKNALIPTLTVVGLMFGTLTVGSVLVEVVFSWPGLGKLTVDGIKEEDTPLVMGAVMVAAIIFVIVNTIADILYAYFDPRLRYHGGGE
ncbi:MAG: ABC transporter permease [Candidatus Hodarchaeales archaeon]|jgi:peptide/nickel transport system permease protein